MRFLGIDYGAKRIGLAISDEDCKFAFPKEIIANDGAVIENLAKIIQNKNVKEIVIGESLNFNGGENSIMDKVKVFTEQLEERFKLPIHREKEFLTTVEARRYDETGDKVDASAAALILQRYLDRKNK